MRKLTAADTSSTIVQESGVGPEQGIISSLGGTGGISGGQPCICFSEAPIGKLGYILQRPTALGFRYRPYGVMVSKSWLFNRGGRPVVYQPEAEAELLPAELRYRHKVYQPPDIDFTWDREWRVQVKKLELDPSETTVVVPNRAWVDAEKDEIAGRVTRRSSISFGVPIPRSVVRDPWHYFALEDLGVRIETDQNK